MKKLLLLTTIILTSLFSKAQDLSYGIVLGTNGYKTQIKDGDLQSKGGWTPINYGIYGSIQIKDKLGLKLHAFLGKTIEASYNIYDSDPFFGTGKLEVNKFTTQLFVKFNVEKSPKRDFYFLAGPRLTFVSNANKQGRDIDFSDFYKKTNFGLSAGFGFDFLKHFYMEFIGDYGFPNTIDFKPYKAGNAGIYFNILLNVESLINS